MTSQGHSSCADVLSEELVDAVGMTASHGPGKMPRRAFAIVALLEVVDAHGPKGDDSSGLRLLDPVTLLEVSFSM